jgi:hypothetical protein
VRDRRNPGCPGPVAKPRAGMAKVCGVLDFKKIILDVVVGDGWAMGRDCKRFPHLSLVGDLWNQGACILGENKPNSGSVSHPNNPVKNGKPRKTVRFGACGNGGIILLHLPKYGRNAPH